jgi:hypothetical protein
MQSRVNVHVDAVIAGGHNTFQAQASVTATSAFTLSASIYHAPVLGTILISPWSKVVCDANVINEVELMTTRDVIAQLLPSSGTGAITAAVMRKLLGETVVYDTVNDIKVAHIDSGVSSINALGNATPGDGLGGLYKFAATQSPGMNKIQSADGQYWELLYLTGYFGSVQKGGGVTTSDLSPGMSAVVKDTTSGNIYLAYNDGGTIATATLRA